MSDQETTPWFDPDVMPVHIGVYETRLEPDDDKFWFQCWNGKRWGFTARNPNLAKVFAGGEPAYQRPAWRGLMQKADE